MSGSLEPVLAAIAQLGGQINRVETRLDGIEERFTRVEERFTRVEERFTRVEERFTSVGERVDGIADELTRLRVDVMGRLDRHQDTLTQIKDDMGVNIAAANHVRDRQTQTRADYDQLANQLSVVHRRLIALEQRLDSKEHGA